VFLSAVILPFFILASCVDVYAEIVLRRNGSGTVTLEYGMTRELEALGKQDGNSRWFPLPVGNADFERTAARVPGLRFRSGETRNRGEGDVVSRVRLDFDGVPALAGFFDGLGESSFAETGGRRILTLSLIDAGSAAAADAAGGSVSGGLASFVGELFRDRNLELRFRLPGAGELFLANGAGERLAVPAGWTVSGGTGAVFKAPLGDLLLAEEPIFLVLSWPAE
jgi:hypothetical protein